MTLTTLRRQTEVPTQHGVWVGARDLADALSNVSKHACTDKSSLLVALGRIRLRREAGGGLVLAATDRYTIGEQTIAVSDGIGSAEGETFAYVTRVPELVKELDRAWKAEAKAGVRTPTAVAVEFTNGGRLLVDGQTLILDPTRESVDGQFPRYLSLFDGWKPGNCCELGLSAGNLAKFAGLRVEGKKDPKHDYLRMQWGERSSAPVLVTAPKIPNFRALVCPVRLDG